MQENIQNTTDQREQEFSEPTNRDLHNQLSQMSNKVQQIFSTLGAISRTNEFQFQEFDTRLVGLEKQMEVVVNTIGKRERAPEFQQPKKHISFRREAQEHIPAEIYRVVNKHVPKSFPS